MRWKEMSPVRVVALIRATGHDTSDSLRWPCQAGRPLLETLSFDAVECGFFDDRALFGMAGFP
jgi:hypothetical protein